MSEKKTYTLEDVQKIILESTQNTGQDNDFIVIIEQIVRRGFVKESDALVIMLEDALLNNTVLEEPTFHVMKNMVAKFHAEALLGVLNKTKIIGDHFDEVTAAMQVVDKKVEAKNKTVSAT